MSRPSAAHLLAAASLSLALGFCPGARAADETSPESPPPWPAVASLPTATSIGYETLRLPHGEHMGLLSGTLLFDAGADIGIGPAVYGAAGGKRGGLFVGGVEVQRRWGLGPGRALALGLFAGGGGGAAAPVGSGLMLRPALTLVQDLGPTLQAGLSWSAVRFPSGQISSNQLGLMLSWRSEFVHLGLQPDAPPPRLSGSTGLGFDRILTTATEYHLHDGTGRHVLLAGARAERRGDMDGLVLGFEAAGAARGGAAGYMEILGSAGFDFAPLGDHLPGWRVGARLSAGLAGGGAIDTGGGFIAKATLTSQWRLGAGWSAGVDVGEMRGFRHASRAVQGQGWFGLDLEPGVDGRGDHGTGVARTEWVASVQHLTRARRHDGSAPPLDTIGLQLDRYIAKQVYITGQAHSAFAGGAGAYSVGLVGLGLSTDPARTLRVGAEALIGASGGGGVNTGGGAIVQGLAWAAVKSSPATDWRVGVGQVRSLRAGFASPVLEISWTRAFGMAARR